MLESILSFSIKRKFLVLALVIMVAGLGVWNFTKLPIDAVPDITNVQVMINTEAAGYTPLEVEQRVTFPLETALAGLPGLCNIEFIVLRGVVHVTIPNAGHAPALLSDEEISAVRDFLTM